MYTSSSLSPTYILPKTVHKGHISANKTADYAYEVLKSTSLTVSVTPLVGFLRLYILTSLSDTSFPSSQAYYWPFPSTHLPCELLIAREDPHFCANCSLIMAIESCGDREVAFVLQVSSVLGQARPIQEVLTCILAIPRM